MSTLKHFVWILLCYISINASANTNTTPLYSRPDVQAYITSVSQEYHFPREQLITWFKSVQIQPAILTSIARPYEKKPWNSYQRIFLQKKRIQNGIIFFKQHRAVLESAEQKYGVPAPIIVAILGVETYYGEQQGSYRVIDALSTLAFDYPARAPFFKKELTEFLLLCRELDLNPTSVQGSYAGAIGQAQFMPSSYRHYAVNYSGEGQIDLRKNPHDAIYSIANYLQKNGWRANEPIATPARIYGSDYKHLNVDAKNPLYTMTQLKASGVTPRYYPPVMPEKPVGLVQLETTGAPQYWIAFNDFYTITRYNTSKQYAMAVFLLAAEIQRGA